MSLIFPKKIVHDEQVREIPPIPIVSLNAQFDPQSGNWLSSSQAEGNKLDLVRSEFLNLQSIEEKLTNSLAHKLILLSQVKREITMILKDHEKTLEMQGFPALELLSKISAD